MRRCERLGIALRMVRHSGITLRIAVQSGWLERGRTTKRPNAATSHHRIIRVRRARTRFHVDFRCFDFVDDLNIARLTNYTSLDIRACICVFILDTS